MVTFNFTHSSKQTLYCMWLKWNSSHIKLIVFLPSNNNPTFAYLVFNLKKRNRDRKRLFTLFRRQKTKREGGLLKRRRDNLLSKWIRHWVLLKVCWEIEKFVTVRRIKRLEKKWNFSRRRRENLWTRIILGGVSRRAPPASHQELSSKES